MYTNEQIHMRDPFVLEYEGRYYLYGTTDDSAWAEVGQGFRVYAGDKPGQWDEAREVFFPAPDFWGKRNFWAPEAHIWKGCVYLFATFKANGICRGTVILKSASGGPFGPFEPWGAERITPADWECLDGTLYVSPEGRPWMVFCHEWLQEGGGTVCAVPLKDDLTGPDGPVTTLFSAKEAPWTIELHHRSGAAGNVTDGPNMIYRPDGQLWMLWSSHTSTGYGIGLAISRSGSVLGPWEQQDEAVFRDQGGHGMVFEWEGGHYLAIHRPNSTPDERPIFLPVELCADGVRVLGPAV